MEEEGLADAPDSVAQPPTEPEQILAAMGGGDLPHAPDRAKIPTARALPCTMQSDQPPAAGAAWCLVVTVTFEKEEQVAEFLSFFTPYAQWIRDNEPTTLAYDVLLSDKDPKRCTIFERYADKDNAWAKIHRSTEQFQAFRPKLAAMNPTVDGHSYWEAAAGFMSRPAPEEGPDSKRQR